MNNYRVETEKIENAPGTWNSLLVKIFKDDEQIGSYERPYHTLFNTFVPFQQRIGDEVKEYALISDIYTRTAVLDLPSCEIIAAEAPSSYGFCPTDFYVPYEEPYEATRNGEPYYTTEGIPGHFGFVAGCHWGDDHSWKVQYLDLSRISEGIINRDDRFGYIELLDGQSLKDAIDMELYEVCTYADGEVERNTRIRIACAKTFDLTDLSEIQDTTQRTAELTIQWTREDAEAESE